MRPKCLVFIAVSLDGYIARQDGAIDWLEDAAANPNPVTSSDHGYAAFISQVDTLVMGRGTFEKVATFQEWPYEGLRVLVLSRHLQAADLPPALVGKVELHAGDLTSLLQRVHGAQGVYVDGGQVIQSFLQAGLIDELTLTHLPVVLGGGISLFGPLERELWLRHERTQVLSAGMVQSVYRSLNA